MFILLQGGKRALGIRLLSGVGRGGGGGGVAKRERERVM